MSKKRNLPVDIYQDPLAARYAGDEILYVFSPLYKFRTWRKLWVALAKAQKGLGLDINDKQIKQMQDNVEDINFDEANEREKETKHDVMAHIHAFGSQCPDAKPIIHLGATSAYVGDNTDIIQIRHGLEIIKAKLLNVIDKLSVFADKHKGLATLAYTHLQPAQPTTVGKRACLWLTDLLCDFEHLEYEMNQLRFLGVKGTTGTQDSFLKLFEGDHKKVKELDIAVAKNMGFEKSYEVSGQTYPRKLDTWILGVLSGISQSAHKFANDVRVLAHLKEIEEPFSKGQVGSSAMAYKKNPMKCERMTSLARLVINMQKTAYDNACGQFFERTLDDSASRRMIIPMSFMAVDGILNLFFTVAQGMVVHEKVIEKNLMAELPFMATEEILMKAVKNGGDRQKLHEVIRKHSMDAKKRVYDEGKDNNLIDAILRDAAFKSVKVDKDFLSPKRFVGRSKEQTEEFLKNNVEPLRKKYKSELGKEYSVTV